MLRTCCLYHQSVRLSLCVRKVYCGKTADWIRMPFRVVNGVGLGMVVIVEGEGQFLGVNLGRPVVTNGAFAKRSSQITLRTC